MFHSPYDVVMLRRQYTSALVDTCILQTRQEGAGDYGYGQPTYTNGTAITCLFVAKPGDESDGAQAQGVDGEIWLPWALTISNLSRIKLTKVYAKALPVAQVFEIVAGPAKSQIRNVVKVKLVTDGTEA